MESTERYSPAPVDPLLYEHYRQRRLARGLSVDGPRHGPGRHWFRRQVLASLVVLLTCGALAVSFDRRGPGTSVLESAHDVPTHPAPQAPDADSEPVGVDVVPRYDPAPAQVLAIIADYEADGGAWPAPACTWLVDDLAAHGLPPWMLAVAWRESRCQSDAYNGDRSTGDDSWGLFQINALGTTLRAELAQTCAIGDPSALLDTDTSLQCAAALYTKYGYRPWHAGTYFR